MRRKGGFSRPRSSERESRGGGTPLGADRRERSAGDRGVHRERFGREDLREVLFRGYRIVYWLRGDTVTVLRVVHGARDLAGLAEREPWQLD
ncbi:MAG: type II toxin-antitoxin system RelE/ParE family toxin [Candidatus Rokubacteria bacterium]|nr:type II toxin-antitoxin system RelE/ParE family toxin [Candidatus Rokubacteria bacterium]